MPTFWLCIFQNNTDEFWNIKVGSVVQGIHICPAAAQAAVSTQINQLCGKFYSSFNITCRVIFVKNALVIYSFDLKKHIHVYV